MSSYLRKHGYIPKDRYNPQTGKREPIFEDERWDDPNLQKAAAEGQLPGDITRWAGDQPPKNAPDGKTWVKVGNTRLPSWKPGSGSGDGATDGYMGSRPADVWGLISSGGSYAKPDSDQPQSQANEGPSPNLLARREAYDRAMAFSESAGANSSGQDSSGAAGPSRASGEEPVNSFYQKLIDEGRQGVQAFRDGFLKQQMAGAQLGIAERDESLTALSRKVDPKKMNLPQVDSWDQILAKVRDMRGLIT